MKIRRTLVLSLILIFMVIPFDYLFAQTDKEIEEIKSWLGQWKRNFASPTIGVALFRANLDGKYTTDVPSSEINFPATAAEIRIFKGVNVSKRGGFYTGVETGVFYFQNINELTFNEGTIGEMHLDYQGGLVFLMAKFGLRMDIGIALFGISAGGEVGIGGTMFSGGFDFYTTSPTTGDKILEGYGNPSANMGVMLDISAEGAIRLGKNFRLIAKAGLVAAPIDTTNNESDYYYYFGDDQRGEGWYWKNYGPLQGEGLTRAVLSNYAVELDPFAIDLRVGFILNYN